jgi:Phage integrase family
MNRPIHFEIPAKKPERAIQFYEKVFGWKFDRWNGLMEYWTIRTGDSQPGINGGLMTRCDPAQPCVNTITGPIGWHTFRRSISTWLIDNDENVKVTQELMRHSHSKTTLDTYAKAVTPSKRRAHERIVDGLLAASDRNVGIDGQAEITNLGRVWVTHFR